LGRLVDREEGEEGRSHPVSNQRVRQVTLRKECGDYFLFSWHNWYSYGMFVKKNLVIFYFIINAAFLSM